MRNFNIEKVRRYALYLFIFSLGFENWDPWDIAHIFTVTKMAGFLYAGLSIINYKKNFSLAYNKQSIISILLVWLWIVIISAFNIWSGGIVSPLMLSFFQAIILFWLLSNDFYRYPEIKKKTFLAFIIGMTIISILVPLDIGVESMLGGRVRFLGANPNKIGHLSVIAIMMIITAVYYNKHFFGKKGLWLLPALPNLITLVGLSGSRGAFFTLLIGLSFFLILYKTTLIKKSIVILLGISGLFYFTESLLQFETMSKRLSQTVELQDSGERLEIWERVLTIYTEYPIFGAGSTGYEKEYLNRFNDYKDPHNIFLYILVSGGIVGLFLYTFFYYSILRKAWCIYIYNSNSISLVYLIVVTMMLMKSGGILDDKTIWFLLAFISTPMVSLVNHDNE